MVKIAIAGATSGLARELIDVLSATNKHEIIALIRKDPSELPSLPGVRWTQTTYEDEAELVRLLDGVHTVLCFFAVHLDPGCVVQKRVIDASIKAGVKRYTPSEWSTGVKLETALDTVSWYAGKVEVVRYLEEINKDKKVLEYCRFQVGGFLNYLGHPHKVAKYIPTIAVQIDIEKKTALLVEGSLEDQLTYTLVEDIVNIVARAIDYTGEWPTVGGIQGEQVTIGDLLRIGETVRGSSFEIEWLKKEDIEAGELNTDKYPRLDLPSAPKEEIDAWSKGVTIGYLKSVSRGVWNVSDEWNQIFSDYQFTKVEGFLRKLWA